MTPFEHGQAAHAAGHMSAPVLDKAYKDAYPDDWYSIPNMKQWGSGWHTANLADSTTTFKRE